MVETEEAQKELVPAIMKLIEYYADAKLNENIRDPICYALYHTWRDTEEQRK